jgi:hypothetical protein
MNEIIIGSLIASLTAIVMGLVAFFFRREREFATMKASLKATHQRLDRIEKLENGVRDDKRR